MPSFEFTVSDPTGEVRAGISEAPSREILERRLLEQGFAIQGLVKPVKDRRVYDGPGRIRQMEAASFWLQFSTLLDGGASLTYALDIAAAQSPNPKLRRVLRDVVSCVNSGSSLWMALQKHPKVFDAHTVGMLRAGEAGNDFRGAMRRFAEYQERQLALQRQIRLAALYLLTALFATLAALLVFRLTPLR